MNDGTGGSRARPRGGRPPRAGVLAAVVAGIALLVAACGGGGGGSSAAVGPAKYQKALAYTRCMRSHGVPNFPDPTSQGRFIPTGIDQRSPQVQSANFACRHLLPGGSGQRSAAQQKLFEIDNLKFAACMRSHGIPNFPDPTFQGEGVMFNVPNGINPKSPQFQSAQQACQAVRNKGGGGS